MKLTIKTVALSVVSIVLTSVNTVHAGGCGNRGGGGVSFSFGGGGIGIGIGGGHTPRLPSLNMPGSVHQHRSTPSYPQPVYSQPNYVPSNPQPVYSQSNYMPSNPQPVYTQSANPQMHQQPMNHQPSYSQSVSQPMQSQMSHSPISGSSMGVSQQQSMNQTQPSQTGYAQQAPQPQPSSGSFAPSSVPVGNASVQGQSAVAAAPSNPTMPSDASNGQAAMSALQMLASMNSPAGESGSTPLEASQLIETQETATAAVQSFASNVGTWQVALPGNQTITLVLGADNSFQWNAVKDGKTNSFQGQYRMESGRLTLVRSNDLQQMTGSWSEDGAKSVFKLEGASDSGLAFARIQ